MSITKTNFADVIDIVKREVKGRASSAEIDWLHQPENIDHWKVGLEAAIEDLLLQFDEWEDRLARVRQEIKTGVLQSIVYEKVIEEFEIWRKKASRYRLGLEQKLLEVSLNDDEREPIVDVLINAIEAHKTELLKERTSTPTDTRLWTIIEKLDN